MKAWFLAAQKATKAVVVVGVVLLVGSVIAAVGLGISLARANVELSTPTDLTAGITSTATPTATRSPKPSVTPTASPTPTTTPLESVEVAPEVIAPPKSTAPNSPMVVAPAPEIVAPVEPTGPTPADIAFNNEMRRMLNENVANLTAEIAQINADLEINRYWLSVATDYDDALSAGKLNATIAGLEARLLSAGNTLVEINNDLNSLPNW